MKYVIKQDSEQKMTAMAAIKFFPILVFRTTLLLKIVLFPINPRRVLFLLRAMTLFFEIVLCVESSKQSKNFYYNCFLNNKLGCV